MGRILVRLCKRRKKPDLINQLKASLNSLSTNLMKDDKDHIEGHFV